MRTLGGNWIHITTLTDSVKDQPAYQTAVVFKQSQILGEKIIQSTQFIMVSLSRIFTVIFTSELFILSTTVYATPHDESSPSMETTDSETSLVVDGGSFPAPMMSSLSGSSAKTRRWRV